MNRKHCPVSANITSYNQTISFSTQINSAKLCYLKRFAPIYASYLLVVSTASFPSVRWTKVPNFCGEKKQVSSLSGKRTGSVFMESHPYLVAFWNTATADKRSLYSKRWLQPPPASLPPACQFQRQEANPPPVCLSDQEPASGGPLMHPPGPTSWTLTAASQVCYSTTPCPGTGLSSRRTSPFEDRSVSYYHWISNAVTVSSIE